MSRNDENVQNVHQAVLADCRQTIDEVSEITDVLWSSSQCTLMEDSMMKQGAAKFLICHDLQEELKDDPHFLTKVVTGYDIWCYDYDPESEQQSSQWKSPNSPRPKIARQVRSSFKTTLISLFDVDGIVHREFVSPGQTVNQKFCLNVLKRLCDSLRRNHPEKWQSGEWFLYHDNAPTHTALSVQQFLAKNKMVVVSHHPYSPDLAPCDYFCTHRWSRF